MFVKHMQEGGKSEQRCQTLCARACVSNPALSFSACALSVALSYPSPSFSKRSNTSSGSFFRVSSSSRVVWSWDVIAAYVHVRSTHTHTQKKTQQKEASGQERGGCSRSCFVGPPQLVLAHRAQKVRFCCGWLGGFATTHKERKKATKQTGTGWCCSNNKIPLSFSFCCLFFFSLFRFFFLFFSLFAEIDSDTQKHLVTKQRKKGRKKERRKQGRKMCTLTVDSQFTLARLTIHFTSHHSSPCRLHGKHKALRV